MNASRRVWMALLAGGVALAVAVAPSVVAAAQGDISTVAGNGTSGAAGDGDPAVGANLNYPSNVAPTADGGFLIADYGNNKVRKVSASGVISTVAGTGTAAFGGDGGLATAAKLWGPYGVAVTADGGFLIADSINGRVRKVSPGGTITTVAGNGTLGYAGDNSSATSANLYYPESVAPTVDGGFLIADSGNNRVRKVSSGGIITTVAGDGTAGFSGDGGGATLASLKSPYGVAAASDGSFLIADRDNNRVRRVSLGGVITTVAGDGMAGSAGDGGAANLAHLDGPNSVALTSDGGFLVADSGNNRVRKVSSSGVISTVAGVGTYGFAGDGGAATAAMLRSPRGVAVTPDGGVLIADYGNARVRKVEGPPAPAPTPSSSPTVQVPAPTGQRAAALKKCKKKHGIRKKKCKKRANLLPL